MVAPLIAKAARRHGQHRSEALSTGTKIGVARNRESHHSCAMNWHQMLASPVLEDSFPLPLDAPFTTTMAEREGVHRGRLTQLVEVGLLRRPIKSVYLAVQAGDSIPLRAQSVSLVAPPEAVICDRQAGWVQGAHMVLAPNEHLDLSPVSMFLPSGRGRLRNKLVDSGERNLAPRDITEVHGLRVTTRLRTACDLGRLLPRDQAIAGLDQMLRLGGFEHGELLAEVRRFRGERGVVQLRHLAPLADGRAESPGESVLRLRWLDTGLPKPEPQVSIMRGDVELARIDLGERTTLFGAEYNGAEWHSEPRDKERDAARRAWLDRDYGWLIKPVEAKNVYGPRQDIDCILHQGFREARARLGRRIVW